MKKTVIICSVMPPIMRPISVTNTSEIQNAYRTLFYYRGGADLLCVEKDSDTSLTVSIPPFSNVKRDGITELVHELEDDIVSDTDKSGIGNKRPFLFDVRTKKVITLESFIDWIPHYTIKNAVFLLQATPDLSSVSPTIRYTQDPTDYGILQLVPLLLAKRRLHYSYTGDWSDDGKRLLTFLVSKEYGLRGNFSSSHGAWDGVKYALNTDAQDPEFNLADLNCTRANTLAKSTKRKAGNVVPRIFDDFPSSDNLDSSGEDVVETSPRIVSLTYMLSIGIDTLYNGAWMGLMEADIDVGLEKYKTILVDTTNKICLVELQPGVNMTGAQMRDELGTDSARLVTETTQSQDDMMEEE